MRPRTELIVAATLFGVLGFGAAALGARHARTDDTDRRRSTYLVGPSGAMGYAQALERLGVRVERWRRPVAELAHVPVPRDSALIAVLGPTEPLTVRDARALVATRADLVLAGATADMAFRCLGYEWQSPWGGRGRGTRDHRDDSARRAHARADSIPRYRLDSIFHVQADSVRADRTGGRRADTLRSDSVFVSRPLPGLPSGAEGGVLVARPNRMVTDSSRGEDAVPVTCAGPVPLGVDTLRQGPQGPVALRLRYTGGRTAILVADDRLFTNRSLRESDAGPFALGLVVPRYRRLIVDEYHHGFVQSGSLAGALWDWSLRSPWGWAMWQLALIGVIALLASGVRFGPIRHVVDRRRRSPLEHVHALATALAAARGNQVAVRLMVRGLRRRLSRAGRLGRGEPGGGHGGKRGGDAWLDSLDDVVPTADGQRALDTLRDLTSRPTDAAGVARAANAVEDVWEALSKRS